jgi:hypothetical protein
MPETATRRLEMHLNKRSTSGLCRFSKNDGSLVDNLNKVRNQLTMSINKKFLSAALTATTVLWMLGAAALPLANAQTSNASLEATIASLQAEIAQITAELNAQGGASMTGSYNFGTSNLTIGSTGAGVTSLQAFLIAQGDLTAVSAPTGYFGTLTQAALAKYQAAHGISPAAGFFGLITRAYLASLNLGTSTGTGTGTGSGTGVTAPSTGVSVSLASDNPVTGSLISSANSGSARVPVLSFDLTAGNSGAVTVSQLQFQKTGVLSDSAISGAYLTQNGQVVAQYDSLNSGLLTFSGLNISIPAGQTQEYTLAVDVSGGLSAGNTTGFSIPSASDVTAWNSSNAAVTASGNFPLNGNVFTVTSVTNPALASVIVSSTPIGTQVTAGTQGNIVGSWTFSVNSSPVYLDNINFHVIGSANNANIQNVKLLVNGTQVGNTLASVPSNGMADFQATSTKLNTGTNNIQVVADVMGSPNMFFQFEILNGYDVLAVDSQYNVPVAITNNGGQGTQVNIAQGQINISQDPNTPTGNVAKTAGVSLAKFDIYAAGEPVKVKYLDFNIQLGGVSATSTLSSEIQNISITDDAGNQVGTTINTPPSNASCAYTVPDSGVTVTGAGNATANATTSNDVYADCFGTSASPINYIVPANTTRVLTLKADIQSSANFSTITGNLSGNSSNLQGQISSASGNTSAENGVALTVVSSSLSPTANNALGTQNVSAGTTNLKIGSYSLSASSAEGVNVNTVSIKLTPASTSWNSGQAAFQNLKLYVNGVQFGQTQGVLSPGATYVFSGSPINVPAGQTTNFDVYADTLSNATGTYSPATDLVGYTGSGQQSFTSVTYSGTTLGQTVSFNGQPAVTVTTDSSNPPSNVIPQNTPGNTLGVFRFTETSNVESVKISQLNVTEVVGSSSSNFNNVQLWNGSTLLGTAAAPTLTATNTWTYSFNSFTTPLVVPQGGSVSVTLQGQAGSYTGGSMADNSTSTFSLATSSIVARGNTSNKTALVSGSASGSTYTVLRSIETVAGTPATGVPPASFQPIGSITITSNAAGDTVPNALTLTFNSTANSTFLNSVVLKDSNNVSITPTSVSTTAYTATWAAGKFTAYPISAGTSYTFQVWGNLGDINPISSQTQSLTAQILNNTDYTYLDGTTNGLAVPLPTTAVPITVVNLLSANGGPF